MQNLNKMEDIDGNYCKKRQLNLSHRNLRSLDAEIISIFGNIAEYLDLSHNRINNMTWIYEFPHLKCLIMDSNRLREAHFHDLTRPISGIHTLMLNKNEFTPKFSDLKTTADILSRLFPNVQYLSLHGNALCPDNLLLQPFCEFVPYEYNYYRAVLLKSLPSLKFLDHFSLDSLQFASRTAGKDIINQQQQQPHFHYKNQQCEQLLTSTPKDLWSKLKSFLAVNSSKTKTELPTTINNQCVVHYASSSYKGLHSEGNRYITNSDL